LVDINLEQLSTIKAHPEAYLYAEVLKPGQIYMHSESTFMAVLSSKNFGLFPNYIMPVSLIAYLTIMFNI
jgi:hypothetical protein